MFYTVEYKYIIVCVNISYPFSRNGIIPPTSLTLHFTGAQPFPFNPSTLTFSPTIFKETVPRRARTALPPPCRARTAHSPPPAGPEPLTLPPPGQSRSSSHLPDQNRHTQETEERVNGATKPLGMYDTCRVWICMCRYMYIHVNCCNTWENLVQVWVSLITQNSDSLYSSVYLYTCIMYMNERRNFYSDLCTQLHN